MKQALAGLPIKITGLAELSDKLYEADEDFDDPLSNARQKALCYYEQLKKPIFSCDSGLYFKNVADEIQPGVKIARVNGVRLSDRQMMHHYMNVANEHGENGMLTAQYKNAICLVFSDQNITGYDGDDICSEEFYISDTSHGDFEEGFPLNSISVHIKSGKYYNDLPGNANKYSDKNGFYNFFKRFLSENHNI